MSSGDTRVGHAPVAPIAALWILRSGVSESADVRYGSGFTIAVARRGTGPTPGPSRRPSPSLTRRCTADRDSAEQLETERSMFVQTAQRVESDGAKLTLQGITPSTLYVSDRPQQVVGTLQRPNPSTCEPAATTASRPTHRTRGSRSSSPTPTSPSTRDRRGIGSEHRHDESAASARGDGDCGGGRRTRMSRRSRTGRASGRSIYQQAYVEPRRRRSDG